MYAFDIADVALKECMEENKKLKDTLNRERKETQMMKFKIKEILNPK